jgi:hypothetical protein
MVMVLRRPCWPSPVVPVLGALDVPGPRAEARVTPPPGKDPEAPAADLLDPAQIEAAWPPGEPTEMGRQSWIRVGQVSFDAVEDPQLAPAQAHYVMVTSAVSGSLLPQG